MQVRAAGRIAALVFGSSALVIAGVVNAQDLFKEALIKSIKGSAGAKARAILGCFRHD
ncbi:MAG TPA: hypothetical protein VE291_04185 [Terracidiphilus sp.]|jgi:hypothetical protein|nr:hypothetical protein [Terracidiphilus sp.]